MPRVTEYTSPVDKLDASKLAEAARVVNYGGRTIGYLGDESARQLGGTISRVGGQIGADIDRHNAMEEISTGSASIAQTVDGLSKSWATEHNTADLNDPTVAQKFSDNQLEPALEKWQSGFHTKAGQEWALRQADQIRSHFHEKMTADMMTRAGDAAIVNDHQAVNGFANASMSDPTSFEHYLDMYHHSLNGIVASSGVSAEEGDKLRTAAQAQGDKAITVSTVMGMVSQNPDFAIKQLQSPRFDKYLDGDEKEKLIDYANRQKRFNDTEQRRVSREHVDDWVSNLYKPDGSVRQITPNDILTLNADKIMRPEDRKAAVNLGAALFKQQEEVSQGILDGKSIVHNDPTTSADFITRIGDPTNPLTTQQIAGAVRDKKLTVGTALELQRKISPALADPIAKLNRDPILKGEFDRASAVITQKDLNSTNEAVKQKIAQFRTDTLRTLQDVIAKGGDVRPYLDPHSKEYLFTPERVRQYMPTKDELASQALQPPLPTGTVKSVTVPMPGDNPQQRAQVLHSILWGNKNASQ